MVDNKVELDSGLLLEASKISNAQNIHQVGSSITAYYGYVQLYNETRKVEHLKKIKEIETKIRTIIQEDRSILYANILSVNKI